MKAQENTKSGPEKPMNTVKNASEGPSKSMKGAKNSMKFPRFFTVIILLLVILAVLSFGSGGFGGGQGIGLPGSGTERESNSSEPTAEQTASPVKQSPNEPAASEETDNPPVVRTVNEYTITIQENRVDVNGTEIKDAAELRTFIEDHNRDGVEFCLNDEGSILETHEWVINTLDELGVSYKQ